MYDNTYIPVNSIMVAVLLIMMKCFERLVKSNIYSLPFPHLMGFTYKSACNPNHSTADIISHRPHASLSHLENKDTYVRMLLTVAQHLTQSSPPAGE